MYSCKYEIGSPEYIEACKLFIKTVGSKKLIKRENIPAYQLANWRQKGFSMIWGKYFALVYPESWEKVFVD